MDNIVFEELEMNKHDLYSALEYIKKRKDNYSLKISNLSLCNELCDELLCEGITFRYIGKTHTFWFNDNLETKDFCLASFIDTNDLERLRIKQITLRYLFGYIKYDLKIDNNLLVIHAPNGYGKSTLIKCIKYFSSMDYENLFKLPFYEFSIKLESDFDNICNIYTFVNKKEKHYMYRKNTKSNSMIFLEFDNNEIKEFVEYKETSKIVGEGNIKIIHNYPDTLDDLGVCVIKETNSVGELNFKEKLDKKIDKFNKIIKDFFGQEKIVYLEKKYIEKNDSKNNIKEFILNLKNSLIIKNNVEPLKEVAGILKLNDNINYEFLSDGEKYIINLFFSLIFSTKYSLLVTTYLYIIDEPELNLHTST